MNFSNQGYDGHVFGAFEVRKDGSAGPGWFIFGRNSIKYGKLADGRGAYVKLCGYRAEGTSKNYNGRVRLGWKTRKEALAALAAHLANTDFPATKSGRFSNRERYCHSHPTWPNNPELRK